MKQLNTMLAGLGLMVCTLSAGAAEAPNLALDAINDYRARAAFPEWSQLITDAVDPVAVGREATRQRRSGPEGAAPALEVWTTQVSFEPGQTVDLFARLDWLGTDQGLQGLQGLRLSQVSGWELTGTAIAEQTGELAELVYRDDGRGADQLAGDGIYSARLQLDADRAPALGSAENVMVKVRAVNAAGERRNAAGGFLYSHPGARLTGVYDQRVRDGHLVLLAQTQVLAAGRYHLAGTLNDAAGTPVATAQGAQRLEPGLQWMELPFYGLIFHRLGTVAGLQLGTATLTGTNGMPNALGPVLSPQHALRAESLTALTSQPFNNPDLLDAAQRLEAQVAPRATRAVKTGLGL